MSRHPPGPFMELPISMETYHQLSRASSNAGYQQEIWEIGAIAIQEWVAHNSPESIPLSMRGGFQWKQLFLPNGTVLRTIFSGKHYHCIVEEDQVRYNGEATSPSGFANMCGVRRNAWKVIWVLFPNTQTWKLASSLRQR